MHYPTTYCITPRVQTPAPLIVHQVVHTPEIYTPRGGMVTQHYYGVGSSYSGSSSNIPDKSIPHVSNYWRNDFLVTRIRIHRSSGGKSFAYLIDRAEWNPYEYKWKVTTEWTEKGRTFRKIFDLDDLLRINNDNGRFQHLGKNLINWKKVW